MVSVYRQSYKNLFYEDHELEPEKALRIAALKHRFSETIFKAQHKLLGTVDPVKIQEGKRKFDKILEREEDKAKRACELKRLKIKRQRKASQIALKKVEKSAVTDHNLESQIELEKLCGFDDDRDKYFCFRSSTEIIGLGVPLKRLGLFLKGDC